MSSVLTSPYGKLLTSLLNQIKSVTGIEHVDQDMGQLEGNSTRPAVQFPCVLVDFTNSDFSNMSNNSQIADNIVQVKLGYAQFTPSSDGVDETYRDEALKYYDLEASLIQSLHGWSPGTEFGTLTRTNAKSSNIAAGIRVRTILFRLNFEDYSCSTTSTVEHPDFEFSDGN